MILKVVEVNFVLPSDYDTCSRHRPAALKHVSQVSIDTWLASSVLGGVR